MKHSILAILAALALLSGCSTSHRPVYSGHQESTEGVPGFVDGKKVSKHVKLGQSYTVDGETYVPRHQPDYVEEGKASWYGPGFHGGKTANGEEFDANALTAAHRTLPLPSIVRVTMLSTGKQVYVRINDRGPFAHSRIIDLSRAAAEKIGLLRAGVAKVRVEYMPEESKRFTDLLSEGRDPTSIDIASEVLNYNNTAPTQYARGDVRVPSPEPEQAVEAAGAENNNGSFWDNFAPVADANANSPRNATQTNDAAPVADVASNDLPAPRQTVAKAAISKPPGAPPNTPKENENSPFALLESSAVPPAPRKVEVAALAPSSAGTAAQTAVGESMYVQFGAFQNAENAERLRKKFTDLSELKVVKKPNSKGETFYHVRMGPYTTHEASTKALEQAHEAGAEARIIRE